jgi:hypothetical protein
LTFLDSNFSSFLIPQQLQIVVPPTLGYDRQNAISNYLVPYCARAASSVACTSPTTAPGRTLYPTTSWPAHPQPPHQAERHLQLPPGLHIPNHRTGQNAISNYLLACTSPTTAPGRTPSPTTSCPAHPQPPHQTERYIQLPPGLHYNPCCCLQLLLPTTKKIQHQ